MKVIIKENRKSSMSLNEIIGVIFQWGRRIFIILKGLFILYFFLKYVKRFYKTKQTPYQFEIAICIGVIYLDLVLIGFEIWHNLNIIFGVFIVNSLMKMTAACHLQVKSMNQLGISGYQILQVDSSLFNWCSAKIWLCLRILVLIGIFVWSFAPIVGLRCSPYVYPLQLYAIFCTDFLSALVDLLIGRIILTHTQAKALQARSESTEDPLIDNPYLTDTTRLKKWECKRKQMRLFIIMGQICSCVQLTIGSIAVFALSEPKMREIFVVECLDSSSVWHAKGLPGELFVTGHMLMTMIYITLYLFVFWKLPYYNGQILKTEKELQDEEEQRKKKLEKENKSKVTTDNTPGEPSRIKISYLQHVN